MDTVWKTTLLICFFISSSLLSFSKGGENDFSYTLEQQKRKGKEKADSIKEAFIIQFDSLKAAQEARRDSIRQVELKNAMPGSSSIQKPYMNALSVEERIGRVALTENFLKGDNRKGTPISMQNMTHLKWSLDIRPHTWEDIVYGSYYQGAGIFYSSFVHKTDIGNPWGIYLFQGARIAEINSRLSFNYEWNLGLSAGWKPYDFINNPKNNSIGSKVNAYINTNFYFKWRMSRHFDLNAGISLTHFSNGNTKDPNNGINTLSGSVGLKYYFNRNSKFYIKERNVSIPKYPKHMQYELLIFASWKDVTLDTAGTHIKKPYLNKKFLVTGFSFSPMYAINYKLQIGGSFDFSYDESAGMTYDLLPNNMIRYAHAPFNEQISIGLAAKVDFTMPYFTISGSVGYDILHGNKKTSSLYQILALKVNISPDIFFNIGYRASAFKNPDFLMFGIGCRFSKYR